MTRRWFFALALLAFPASPGSAAPPPPPAAAQPDPLKAAFDALSEPDRRGIQAALIWTADFAGAVTGGYGPRTHDALLASARGMGVAPAAALDAPNRARLLADADAARRAVDFTLVRDPRSGIAIGVPMRLAPLRSILPDGTRYASADGSFAIELTARPGAGPEGLADALARLTRDAPGRRVTYRLQRPDFVVATGQAGDATFYARSALDPSPPSGSPAAVRGFVVSHPESDRGGAVALAVAASFDPFPAGPASVPAPTTVPSPKQDCVGSPTQSCSILRGNEAGMRGSTHASLLGELVGAAVLVGPGLALTRIDRGRCAEAEVGGAPADWMRRDPATGLALLRLADHPDAAPVALSVGGGAPGLALFLVPGDGAPVLAAADATREAGGRLRAPLQGVDAGAVLLDGSGALAGLTGSRDGRPVSVAGTVVETRYDLVEAGPIAAFLRDASVPTAAAGGGPAAPGEAVARWRPAILPLRCHARRPP